MLCTGLPPLKSGPEEKAHYWLHLVPAKINFFIYSSPLPMDLFPGSPSSQNAQDLLSCHLKKAERTELQAFSAVWLWAAALPSPWLPSSPHFLIPFHITNLLRKEWWHGQHTKGFIKLNTAYGARLLATSPTRERQKSCQQALWQGNVANTWLGAAAPPLF